MSVLAVLTPPFLVCAAVIAAIVAFVRHEMGRGRARRGVGAEGNPGLPPTSQAAEGDGGAGSEVGPAPSARRDD
jgi:hypothetical protein